MPISYLDALKTVLDEFASCYTNQQPYSSNPNHNDANLVSYNGVPGYFIPKISRIHYNGDKTIVWFADGGKCIVNCSPADNYDRQTAIAYAICKRMFGFVNKDGIVDGNGFGQKMKKLVDSGFDQVAAERDILEKKRQAKVAHEAKQKADQEAAFERKAKRLAEEILLKRRATDIANDIEDSLNKLKTNANKPKQMLNENKPYVRPNKPFKDFTIDEKHEYWREQNKKRKLNK